MTEEWREAGEKEKVEEEMKEREITIRLTKAVMTVWRSGTETRAFQSSGHPTVPKIQTSYLEEEEFSQNQIFFV